MAHDIIHCILSFVVLFFAATIMILNATVLVLLFRKSTKKSTDVLVFSNLSLNILFGTHLGYLAIAFIVGSLKWSSENSRFDTIMIMVFDFLVVILMMLQIIMAVNRYVAIMKPLRYKLLFNRQNTLKYILSSSLVPVFLFTARCLTCFVENNFTELFITDYIWFFFKVSLVATTTVLLIITYRAISRELGVNILRLPAFCSATDNNYPVTKTNIDQFKETKKECDDKQSNSHDSNNPLEPSKQLTKHAASTTEGEQGEINTGLLNLPSSTQNCASEPNMEPNQPKTNRSSEASGCSSLSIAELAMQRKSVLDQKKFQMKKRVTATFFITTLIFVCITLPNAILVCVLIFIEPGKILTTVFYLSELLYGLLFLAGPIIHAFSCPQIIKSLKNVVYSIS